MKEHQNALTGLLQLTEEIHDQAKAIRSKMEDNEAEQLETLQLLFEKREHLIKKLDTYMQQTDFHWTEENRKVIHQLKEYEQLLKPLMNGLHQSFLTQMNLISQTKQVSQKYIGAYQNMSTNGSFFDKRK
jgi:two-component SAPR family response regulator